MEGRHVGLDFYDLLIEVQSRCFASCAGLAAARRSLSRLLGERISKMDPNLRPSEKMIFLQGILWRLLQLYPVNGANQ